MQNQNKMLTKVFTELDHTKDISTGKNDSTCMVVFHVSQNHPEGPFTPLAYIKG